MHVKYMWNFHLVFHIQFHTSVKNNVKSPCENHVKWCPPFHIIKCCEKDMWNCGMCAKLCEMCAVKSCTIDHVNLTCEIYKNIHRKLWKKVCEKSRKCYVIVYVCTSWHVIRFMQCLAGPWPCIQCIQMYIYRPHADQNSTNDYLDNIIFNHTYVHTWTACINMH